MLKRSVLGKHWLDAVKFCIVLGVWGNVSVELLYTDLHALHLYVTRCFQERAGVVFHISIVILISTGLLEKESWKQIFTAE